MITANFGTVICATLRTEDLLEAFADELEYQCDRNKGLTGNIARRKLVTEARRINPENEDASYLVNEGLYDALNEFAPPYSHFGSLEGDGADFGYWTSEDFWDELPRVENGDEAKELGEDSIFVNDHGNVTLYGGNGKEIWSIV